MKEKFISNIDILYIVINLLVIIILLPINFSYSLSYGGLMSVLGICFLPMTLGMNPFSRKGDERSNAIMNGSYTFSFLITMLVIAVFCFIHSLFGINIPLTQYDLLSLILTIGQITQASSIAFLRRIS